MYTKVIKGVIVATVLSVGVLVSTPVSASNTSTHEVLKGDTLYFIGKEHGIGVKEMIEMNQHFINPNLIYVGDTVHLSAITPAPEPPEEVNGVSASERELLERLVEAESRSESYEGKVAVAEVVLNRVESNGFPNSINEVIKQPSQFSPVTNGAINTTASADSVKAVNEALDGTNTVNNALFFWNPDIASNRWLDTKPTIARIGNHEFK